MLRIEYVWVLVLFTLGWLVLRGGLALRNRRLEGKRELKLLFVYICIAVVIRFTFFPFFKVDGQIQPLYFVPGRIFPPRINWIPFVELLDYPEKRNALINVIGNTGMFLPLGMVWPWAFPKLDTHKKALLAGLGTSGCIEAVQLLFYDRVTDIDDLLLNTLGYTLGYLLYLLIKKLCRKKAGKKAIPAR